MNDSATPLPQFNDPQLWLRAMTHRSYANEHSEIGQDNERLEFLGDAVLGFAIGKMLFVRFPNMREGELSQLRSRLVNNRGRMAAFAVELGLDRHLRLGRGAESDGGRHNPELLSDAFEAMLGAYFLDRGIEAVQEFIESLFLSVADEFASQSPTEVDFNVKGQFQEWALERLGENPQYRIVEERERDWPPATGKANRLKEFVAEVWVENTCYGSGSGRSKKAAHKAAAAAALQRVRMQSE